MTKLILQIAIPTPLRKIFDYLYTDASSSKTLVPGMRIEVPFGKQKKTVGLLIAIKSESNYPYHKLKRIYHVIDEAPIIDKEHLELIHWSSRYYHYPLGEVIFSTVPSLLRQGKALNYPEQTFFSKVEYEHAVDLGKAEKQLKLLNKFNDLDASASVEQIKTWDEYSPYALKALLDKQLLKKTSIQQKPDIQTIGASIHLEKPNKEQQQAIDTVVNQYHQFNSYLLNGITGSGKTQVYLHLAKDILMQKRQVLVLLPEINLTPQFIERFEHAFAIKAHVYHSNLTDKQRLATWLECKEGSALLIIGTRSSAWLPLKNPGLIIIDEEHDISYKQQDGFRYSARDIAVYRAKQYDIPVILGSATPSLESLHNVQKGLYQELLLTKRIGQAVLPNIEIIDLKSNEMHGALSRPLINKIKKVLDADLQVLLFINQRGYSPAQLCDHCGNVLHCERCQRPMIYHKKLQLFWCHHCDKQLPQTTRCNQCNHLAWIEVGHGTERIEKDISELFPAAKIVRIDRDSTRKKGQFQEYLTQIQNSDANILVGTQMLAKGHDFPNLSLVGIVDIDSGLYSSDFRASERMAQLITQVSGRAGRAHSRGDVMLQTHHPEHPLINSLIHDGYNAFSKLVLQQREESQLPPFSYHALLRAEATDIHVLNDFLSSAKQQFTQLQTKVELLGPIASPMPLKAGKHRMQILLESMTRSALANTIANWLPLIEILKTSKKVRWSLDIDPQDMI